MKDVQKFPVEVQARIASLLDDICYGETPTSAKPLKGFGGAATVMEIVQDYRTDTYRAFYTAKIGASIFVLHCIQKKSKTGIGLTQQDKETIARRLKAAMHEEREL